ncbi:hypothetical protein TNCV_3370701 [Trichonephila clavipes]|nr:hypothetical protein TNCV_3370701 [Trichonephila clavipes]
MSTLLSKCLSERRAIVTQSASVSKGTWADAGCVFTSRTRTKAKVNGPTQEILPRVGVHFHSYAFPEGVTYAPRA